MKTPMGSVPTVGDGTYPLASRRLDLRTSSCGSMGRDHMAHSRDFWRLGVTTYLCDSNFRATGRLAVWPSDRDDILLLFPASPNELGGTLTGNPAFPSPSRGQPLSGTHLRWRLDHTELGRRRPRGTPKTPMDRLGPLANPSLHEQVPHPVIRVLVVADGSICLSLVTWSPHSYRGLANGGHPVTPGPKAPSCGCISAQASDVLASPFCSRVRRIGPAHSSSRGA